MNKLIFYVLLTVCMFCADNAVAQSGYFTRDNSFEIEVGAGPNFGVADVKAMKNNKVGADCYAEFRYNFDKLPLAVGVQAAFNVVKRGTLGWTDGVYTAQSNYGYTSSNIMLTCDYRKRVNSFMVLFGGVGVGMCNFNASANLKRDHADFTGEVYSDNLPNKWFAFMPRVGVHLANLARVTVGYKFQERANRHAFVTLGFTLGFKPRR